MTYKIGITGGSGFIGYHLAKKLSVENHFITLIDNQDPNKYVKDLLLLDNVEYIKVDLCDVSSLNCIPDDYDYIYHLAALLGVDNVIKNPFLVLQTNAESTLNILKIAKKQIKLKSLFFSSTSEVYTGTSENYEIPVPTSEEVPICLMNIKVPRSAYSLSKLFGESACINSANENKYNLVIGRYHNIYGPMMGFRHVIPEVFSKIISSNFIELPSADHTRSFCYIDDAISSTIKLMHKCCSKFEIVNIGNSSEEISIYQLVKMIATTIGKDIEINILPPTKGSIKRRCPDITKLIELTEYNPIVSLKQGLIKTFNWYNSEVFNI
jgi:UDP-glucose 4-epimerase